MAKAAKDEERRELQKRRKEQARLRQIERVKRVAEKERERQANQLMAARKEEERLEMARKKSFSKIANQMAREAERRDREELQRQKAHLRELEKAQREAARAVAQADKFATQKYLEDRAAYVEALNGDLQASIQELSTILEVTLESDDTVAFETLLVKEKFRLFRLPAELDKPLDEPRLDVFRAQVPKPSSIGKFMPGAAKKYENALTQADVSYEQALAIYQHEKQQRDLLIAQLREQYEQDKQAFDDNIRKHNEEVEEFKQAYLKGDPDAVIAYCSLVLERSDYPEGFPQEYKIAFLPDSKELVVEYELPGIEVVPTIGEYLYTKSKDDIKEKGRPASEIKNQYQDIVAAVCLRTIHEMFEADQAGHLEIVVFNGFVQTVDPATGKDVRPHLISLRTIREKFSEINLARVDKRVCLRNLGAQVSPRPAEMQAVKPVVDFNMVDKRFVEQSDVLADIESRPNLMDLNPFEFENFISNLFDQIGFEAKLTRSSKDGGVDVVAFDPRPILGGKVVIQAKRYKNVVGVSAVRDMYGTMINEGAGKGILVTTSHYGPDAYDFAKDKPIELIDGGGLLYLLQQQGIEARIVFPEE